MVPEQQTSSESKPARWQHPGLTTHTPQRTPTAPLLRPSNTARAEALAVENRLSLPTPPSWSHVRTALSPPWSHPYAPACPALSATNTQVGSPHSSPARTDRLTEALRASATKYVQTCAPAAAVQHHHKDCPRAKRPTRLPLQPFPASPPRPTPHRRRLSPPPPTAGQAPAPPLTPDSRGDSDSKLRQNVAALRAPSQALTGLPQPRHCIHYNSSWRLRGRLHRRSPGGSTQI
jgi:hypothetical protein